MKQPKLLNLDLIKSQTKNMYHQDKISPAACCHPLDHQQAQIVSALDKGNHQIGVLVKSLGIIITAIMMTAKQ